ncbi:MAG: hypothetical protein KH427_02045 [Actinomycetaceae bacterium]|nr:hypothetical protein [Actinomycetaceae bacterium]
MNRTRLSILALVASGALLAGCSGGASSDGGGTGAAGANNQTFTFSGSAGPAKSIHVEFPQELLDAMGSEAGNILITAADLKAYELDSTKYCAVEVTNTLADGALEALSATDKVDYESMTAYDLFVGGYGAKSLYELFFKYAENPDEIFLSGAADELLTLPAGPERDQVLQDWRLDGFDVDGFKAEVQRIKDDLASEASNADPVATLMDRLQADPLSDLDEAAPAPGRYLSDDGTKIIDVTECALEPFTDDGYAVSGTNFPIKSADGGSVDNLGSVKYAVMKDGNVTITSSSISGYQQDSSGNWLSK